MKKHIPCWILTILMAVIMAFFDIRLYTSKLLPTKLVLLIAALLFVLLLIVALLLWDVKRFGRFITGCLLFLLLTVGMAAGAYALHTAIGTLENLSGEKVKVSHVGVYTLSDSSIASLEDLRGADVGILGSRDRENTDATIRNIQEEINGTMTIWEYASLTAMAEELLNGNTQAMIINEAFVPLLTETEGFEDFESKIREVTIIRLERPVETNPDNNTNRPETIPTEIAKTGNCFVVYISGSDSRIGLSDQARSDTNILAVVNPDTKQVLLLSTPRDYYVPLSISDGIPDKLTHAGLYGIDVSMDTLAMLYGVDVDYYFRVDFSGFKEIIDALGGITVYSSQAFTGSEGTYFAEGNNDVTGSQALEFARERYSFIDGDEQRGRNQMEVIKAVIRKCMSPSILTSFTDLLSVLEDCFQMSVPYNTIADIVRNQLEDGGSWNIASYSVTGFGNFDIPYSMDFEVYVMEPDWDTVEHAKDLIRQVIDGDTLTQE